MLKSLSKDGSQALTNAERRTPNAERRTPNAERQARHAPARQIKREPPSAIADLPTAAADPSVGTTS